jgi:hypothetical protein
MEQAVRLLWEWASWGLPGGDSKAAERVHGGEGGGGQALQVLGPCLSMVVVFCVGFRLC